MSETIAAIVYGAIVVALIAFLVSIAAGKLGSRRVSSAAQNAALATFEAFQNRDGCQAVEEIMFTRESWTEADHEGDDGDRTAVSADDERVTDPR